VSPARGKAIVAGQPFSIPEGRGCSLKVEAGGEALRFIISNTTHGEVTLQMANDRKLAMEISEGRRVAVNTSVIMWSFGDASAMCPFTFTDDCMLATSSQDAALVLGVDAGDNVVLVQRDDTVRRLIFVKSS